MSMQASVADRRAAYSIPEDVLAGLTAPQKSIPSKYFYDAEGSRLFESICLLPEYYVARTETALLGQVAKDSCTLLLRPSLLRRDRFPDPSPRGHAQGKPFVPFQSNCRALAAERHLRRITQSCREKLLARYPGSRSTRNRYQMEESNGKR